MPVKHMLLGSVLALLAFAPMSLQAQEPLKPVKLITAEAGNPDRTRQFFGQVVARQTVDLAFQVPGQIVEFPVIEGTSIAQGELIAQLDLESFELSLEQAQLQKEQAERNLDRLERLSSRTASQVQIDDTATALSLAKVAVKNAEYALKHATLLAPFDALVATREVANFTTTSAGTPVVRLHDMSEIRVEVDVPEILFLGLDQSDDFTISARFPSSDVLYPLDLREFNAETSKVGQSFRVTLGMNPPEGLRILPGASVTVIASVPGADTGGILLPKQAIFIDDNGDPAVMAFTPKEAEEGHVNKLLVQVVPAQGNDVLVTSGIAPGTEVVAAGGAALKDGQAVRRFAGFGN
ncbi:efflux RND transporter periplasmic adaptor subunit (plasmid) [Pseudorhodobacter turbinis]|uniref:Efflux RND transporter periplasmic adaptor subunit n=1 Tax=Pseudorhodobacter turbinis TaxID=2500533 RepID=A0A4P8EKX7_9RHOB|nr:efflux RND transporter periplasmic adaptor subunit [Pseudorhodobacter turbinis]QCO57706.1 efflux RND transporter periplasmic adaptor subunit [Pseudorhodobacter turbinis]